jgi:hypothetical protein
LFIGFIINTGVISTIIRFVWGFSLRMENSLAVTEKEAALMEEAVERVLHGGMLVEEEYIADAFIPSGNGYQFSVIDNIAAIIVMIPVIIIFVIWLRWFLSRWKPFVIASAEVTGIKDIRKKRDKISLRERFGPRFTVRRCYRKFLTHYTKGGFRVKPDDTSAAIADTIKAVQINAGTGLDELRSVYIRARYGSAEITRQDANRAKNALRKITGTTRTTP